MITLDGEDGAFGKKSILHLAVASGSKGALMATLAATSANISSPKVRS